MSQSTTLEQQEMFSQARQQRAKRNHLAILLHVRDEFVAKQMMTLIAEEVEIIVSDPSETLIAQYAQHAPDMVLMELKEAGTPCVPRIYDIDDAHFIVMLAQDESQARIMNALEEGAQGFITRPYTQRKLDHYMNIVNTAKAQRAQNASVASTTLQ